MISTTAAPSPDFEESLQLLLKLHELTLEDRDESEEADAIRDAMDGPWYRLTEDQAKLLRGLSADLYSIESEPKPTSETINPTASKAIEIAASNRNWIQTLELIRENQSQISPSDAAILRGVCWAHLQHPDVAIIFLREGARLKSLEPHEEFWLLICELRAGRIEDALPRAEDIAHTETNPLLVLTAAEILFERANQVEPSEAEAAMRLAIETAKKGVSITGASPTDETLQILWRSALLQMAFGLEQLGETYLALDACRQVLKRAPDDLDALMVFGYLSYEDYPIVGKEEFRRQFVTRRTISLPAIPVRFPSFTLSHQ